MTINPHAISIRTKKLGLLIYDARVAARRNIQECAQVLGISEDIYLKYEKGISSPSLPEVEILAYYLNIPLDHFWGRHSLSEDLTGHEITHGERLVLLRQKMIGAVIRQVRTNANLSPKELADRTGEPEADLRAYELGEKPIPLPVLEVIISVIGSHIEYFIDDRGPVGKWHSQRDSINKFLELPPDLQEFVSKPLNRPYVELARKLSELSVDKLRAVAEGLLEITY
jgi:transcriptional regulator with XRE-family HTH domain